MLELFSLIGECIWRLQYVEDALHMSIVMKSFIVTPGDKSEQESRGELQRMKKMTLGRAVKNAEDKGTLPQALLVRFKPFLDARNWLVHNSVDQHGAELYSAAGREIAAKRLQVFIAEARALQKLVMHDIATYAQSRGVDVETAFGNAEAQIAAMSGRQASE